MWRHCLLLLVLLATMVRGSDFFSRSFAGGSPFSTSSPQQQDDSLYKVLEVDRDASLADIKKAYRRRAMLLHPDKGGDEEQFKKLSQAYEILSDVDKRQNYDRFGVTGNGNGGGDGGRSAADATRDLFRGFGSFGGFGGFGGGFSMPIVFQLDLSLEDLFKGRDLSIPLNTHKVSVQIKPGMLNGQELILRGKFADERGAERDIIFRLKETRHPVFTRKNADLLVELSISLADALLGFERSITHLDGKEVVLGSKRGEICGTGDVLVVPGLGMPVYDQDKVRGRLFVRIRVDMPKRLWLDGAEAHEMERLLEMAAQPRHRHSRDKATGKSDTPAEKLEPGSSKRQKKSDKDIDKDKARHHTLAKGDLNSFGSFGAPDHDDEDENPFASFFFR